MFGSRSPSGFRERRGFLEVLEAHAIGSVDIDVSFVTFVFRFDPLQANLHGVPDWFEASQLRGNMFVPGSIQGWVRLEQGAFDVLPVGGLDQFDESHGASFRVQVSSVGMTAVGSAGSSRCCSTLVPYREIQFALLRSRISRC
jgi:hypothetical protein